ncbi:thioredoxin domain-containing protein [Amycolatopsis rhabdoformis]|uniref:Thioredoxin domain-containing protein n=1 Tax=Amycolatopsis rhabdoformis TaxID=1448059 RepID=A0ABZ1IEM2_9PSEU|nr:thioredoxin domain-containing protein [Amycolatopsis rhabdoformis]WSE32138.1 thioredoxin domain-containing protein [Amycolatopsis rhabdoformis]
MARKQNRNPVTAKKGLSANAWTTIGVLVVAVLVIGGVLVFNHKDAPAAPPGAGAATVLNPPGSNTLTTAPGGPVTVVEFLDYQCPVCEAYYQNVTKSIEHDYAGRITFVTRNFPLPMHPLAVPAAQAAEAAAMQGKYHEMYDKLYADYPTWALAADGKNVSDDAPRAQTRFDGYARELGLDLTRFHADAASPAVQKRIDQGKADGTRAGVTGTPTIFVNGTRFEPTGDTYAALDRQLRGELDQALAA